MSALAERATPVEGAKNISILVEGKTLYILCDLSKDFGVSSTGKSTIIGTTSGNKALGNSGASLGVNIFIKDLAKRNLKPDAVAELRTEEFQDCSEGCQWRVESDGCTLCVKIDFDTVEEREASSGKTVLLATSGSFKSIGKTGISFNLNCYRQKEAAFDPSKITEAAEMAGLRLDVGSAPATTDSGYTVHYKTATEAMIAFSGNAGSLTETASLKDCRLGDLTVTAFVVPLKAKKAKKEGGDAATGPGKASVPASGGLLDASLEKVQNAAVTCSGKEPNGDFTVTVTMDPSQVTGVSASGKSLTVATTGGFQTVGDSDGVAICRLQVLAYRPVPHFTDAEVATAVETVLSKHNAEELPTLKVKNALSEVLTALGAPEAMRDTLKASVTSAMMNYIRQSNKEQVKEES